MTPQMNPYVNFERGRGREAMEFYRSVFGGELTVDTFGDYGQRQDHEGAELVAHAVLVTSSGFRLMGNDAPDGAEPSAGGNVSINWAGAEATDGEELRGYWAQLSAGGTVLMPLERQAWGDHFGMCIDRFGLRWMINISVG